MLLAAAKWTTTRWNLHTRTVATVNRNFPKKRRADKDLLRFRQISRPFDRSRDAQGGKLDFKAAILGPQSSYDYTRYREELYKTWSDSNKIFFQPMKSYVQILTTPTADTRGTALLLHFDTKRYLIGNVGEGLQRAMLEGGARLLKLTDCFITGRAEWSNLGGLVGFLLTVADGVAARDAAMLEHEMQKKRPDGLGMSRIDTQRSADFSIIGPPNLNHMLATTRHFVFRRGMPVQVHEVNEQTRNASSEDPWAPYSADEHVKVWALSIAPEISSSTPIIRLGAASPGSRKRGIEEVDGSDSSFANGNFFTARDIVTKMFNSDWQFDALHETRLGDVKLPAAIFYRDPSTRSIQPYTGPLPGSDTEEKPNLDQIVLIRRPWPAALVQDLPPTTPSPQAISYIVRGHQQRGKFDVEAAKRHKVPPGPKFAALSAGKTVENDDGETITPDMVLSQPKEGAGFAVVDLPEEAYIGPLVDRLEWRQPTIMAGVTTIIWICGPGVAGNSRLHKFMSEFDHVQHIVSSPDYCNNRLTFQKAAAAAVKLGQLDPKRYLTPIYHNTTAQDDKQPLPAGVQVALPGQSIQLSPSFKIVDDDVSKPFDIKQAQSQIPKVVLQAAKELRSRQIQDSTSLEEWSASLPPLAREVEIITLGTGSAVPSSYRNVSSTLVRIPHWGNVLLDCGENTIGQLRRIFPPEELQDVLRNLRLIFISHMHADHHLGTASMIKAWYNEVHDGKPFTSPAGSIQEDWAKKGLAVVAGVEMHHWLREYADVEDFGISRIARLCASTAVPDSHKRSELNQFTDNHAAAAMQVNPAVIGLGDIQRVNVNHCKNASAVAITFPGNVKISYSGDCRPSKSFAAIGRGSTVCIHEATFDDDMSGDARAKKHSTTSEALAVAQAMGAKACILTHFSQRYQKVPIIERFKGQGASVETDVLEEGTTEDMTDGAATTKVTDVTASPPNNAQDLTVQIHDGMKVCIAFDYMRVKVGEIAEAEQFLPVLSEFFIADSKQTEAFKEAMKAAQPKTAKQLQREARLKARAGVHQEKAAES